MQSVLDYPCMVSNSPNNTNLFVCNGSTTIQCYVYSISSDSWTTIASLPTGVNRPYCAFGDNYFYVFGGNTNNGWKLDTTDVLSNDWVELSQVNLSSYGAPGHGSAVAVNNRYIFGVGNSYTSYPVSFRINIDPDGANETVVDESNFPDGISRIYHNSAVYVPRLKRIYSIGGVNTDIRTKIFIANVSFPTSEPTNYPTKFPSTFPTMNPTTPPGEATTKIPTFFPSPSPTDIPTDIPTIKSESDSDNDDITSNTVIIILCISFVVILWCNCACFCAYIKRLKIKLALQNGIANTVNAQKNTTNGKMNFQTYEAQ